MSKFALGWPHKGKSVSTLYDEAVGLGVDNAGFANLPLNPGGTDGADLATAAPTTLQSGTTYDAGTRTLTRATSGQLIATWTGILTPNTLYRVKLRYNVSASAVYIQSNSGTLYSGAGDPQSGELDALFTTGASDTDFKISGGTLITGSVTLVSVTPHTGLISGRRFFVRPSTGSDTNDNVASRDPSTPLATITKAASFVRPGRGDQILVAEGETLSELFPGNFLTGKDGGSPIYPTVIQTYDPADPLNEAKYGRSGAGKRPVLSATNKSGLGILKYFAFRGFDINPGNLALQSFGVTAATTSKGSSYILFENMIYRYSTGGTNEGAAPVRSVHHIYRMCTFYGTFATDATKIQGVFVSAVSGVTLEDCVFWHNGWNINNSRDDDYSIGGLKGMAVYEHPAYIQYTTDHIIYRRNLIVDGPADGGHLLSDVVATENLMINCPIGLDVSPTTSYNAGGNLQQVSYNAILECNDFSSTEPRGIGIWTSNGAPGSEIHHNLVARTLNPSGTNRCAFQTSNIFGSAYTSYAYWHHNVAYLAVSGRPSTVVPTDPVNYPYVVSFDYNIWDDPTSGTNQNIGDVSFPNPYTADQLLIAEGYTGADAAARKQAFIDYAIENPDKKPGRSPYNRLMAGYGIVHAI